MKFLSSLNQLYFLVFLLFFFVFLYFFRLNLFLEKMALQVVNILVFLHTKNATKTVKHDKK